MDTPGNAWVIVGIFPDQANHDHFTKPFSGAFQWNQKSRSLNPTTREEAPCVRPPCFSGRTIHATAFKTQNFQERKGPAGVRWSISGDFYEIRAQYMDLFPSNTDDLLAHVLATARQALALTNQGIPFAIKAEKKHF